MIGIFCDIDGVIRNLIHGITLYAGERYSDEIHNSITTWNKNLFNKKIIDWIKSPEPFRLAMPYDGSLNFIKDLRELDLPLYFLTHQNGEPEVINATIEWLNEWGFDKYTDGTIIVKDFKDKLILQNKIDWFLIDDHPNINGIDNDKIIHLKRPWNNGKFNSYHDIILYITCKVMEEVK